VDCLLTDSAAAGYVPAGAVSVPTSPHAAAAAVESGYPDFFPSPVVLSSRMLKNAPPPPLPLIAPGLHCSLSTEITLGRTGIDGDIPCQPSLTLSLCKHYPNVSISLTLVRLITNYFF